MNFDITRPPTAQELSVMDNVMCKHHRFMIFKCMLGFCVAHAFILWAHKLSTIDPAARSSILSFIMFVRLYSLGFVAFGIRHWLFRSRLNSDPLKSGECESLLKMLNHKSRSYVQMVNRQCRPMSYFDYSLIMKWHAAEQKRNAPNSDACAKLNSL